MTIYIEHDAELVYLGYAAPFGKLSYPLARADGRRELIHEGAFDAVLRRPSAALNFQVHHLGPTGTIASIARRSLRLWIDSFGLGFEAGPFGVNGRNVAVVNSIILGGIRSVSWQGSFAEVSVESIEGELIQVVHCFRDLSHISLVDDPAYPATAAWCSHEFPDALPERLKPLARFWYDNRPASNAPTKPAERHTARRRDRPQAWSRPEPRAAISAAIANPAPPGFTQEEWKEFGFMEAAGRRAHKEHKRREQERQRERNRARRVAT